jgi:serpin B
LVVLTAGVPGRAEVAQAGVPRVTQPNVPAADLQALVAGNNRFAEAVFARQPTGSNVFFSPYSLSAALAMTYAGAKGETARQMASALDFSLPPERLHPAFDALDLALASRGTDRQSVRGTIPGFKINVANALWGQTGRTFAPDFLNTLGANYGAGLRLLDFSAGDAARVTINDWVAEQTAQRIKDLIPQGALSRDSRLVLTNAVYFLAPWTSKFEPRATADGPFQRLVGNAGTAFYQTVQVPMMHQAAHFGYAAGENWQAVELAYGSGQMSMVVLLPAAGQMPAVEQTLATDGWDKLLAGLQPTHVELTLPRFGLSSSLSLKEALGQLGMKDAFDPRTADFSGMDGTRELSLGDVLHKTFLKVDENGTEAAAATAVIMVGSAFPANTVTMTVDRPFLFVIRDRPTGQIVFMGRTVDPASK